MPDDFRDLRHGGALSNHFGRQTMAKEMRRTPARAANSGSDKGPPHNVANCRWAC
jgi:hypothetical protein